jgi:hypothetical protein
MMHGNATTAAAEARPVRLIHGLEAQPARPARGAGPTSAAAAADLRLREAVRALLSAIDALP